MNLTTSEPWNGWLRGVWSELKAGKSIQVPCPVPLMHPRTAGFFETRPLEDKGQVRDWVLPTIGGQLHILEFSGDKFTIHYDPKVSATTESKSNTGLWIGLGLGLVFLAWLAFRR